MSQRHPDSTHRGVNPRSNGCLEPFRFRWKRRTALDYCLVVLLIGKPVPTFPEALAINRASHRKTGAHFSGSTLASPPLPRCIHGQSSRRRPGSTQVSRKRGRCFVLLLWATGIDWRGWRPAPP